MAFVYDNWIFQFRPSDSATAYDDLQPGVINNPDDDFVARHIWKPSSPSGRKYPKLSFTARKASFIKYGIQQQETPQGVVKYYAGRNWWYDRCAGAGYVTVREDEAGVDAITLAFGGCAVKPSINGALNYQGIWSSCQQNNEIEQASPQWFPRTSEGLIFEQGQFHDIPARIGPAIFSPSKSSVVWNKNDSLAQK